MKINAKTQRGEGADGARTSVRSELRDSTRLRLFQCAGFAGRGCGLKSALRSSAFTLLELLVVIGIIALISAIALPVLRSFKPDPLKTASNQLLNDLAYARHRAIADHTTVYVCFMPPLNLLKNLDTTPGNLNAVDQNRLLKSQYVGYAMYEKRSIGDQPGASQPHWITGWHQLPEGTAFPKEMFLAPTVPLAAPPSMARVGFGYWSFDYSMAGDIIVNPENTNQQAITRFPAIAFDYRGSLVPSMNGWNQWAVPDPPPTGYQNPVRGQVFDCVIPITQGHSNPNGTNWTPAGFRENPPGSFTNIYCNIVIDGPTGRARRDVRALQ